MTGSSWRAGGVLSNPARTVSRIIKYGTIAHLSAAGRTVRNVEIGKKDANHGTRHHLSDSPLRGAAGGGGRQPQGVGRSGRGDGRDAGCDNARLQGQATGAVVVGGRRFVRPCSISSTTRRHPSRWHREIRPPSLGPTIDSAEPIDSPAGPPGPDVPSCEQCGGCQGCCRCCLCGPPGRFWVRDEYIGFWTKGDSLPVLVTTTPTGTLPATTTLFGGNSVNTGFRSGNWITGGMWFDCCQTWGLQGNYLLPGSAIGNLQQHVRRQSGTGSPVHRRHDRHGVAAVDRLSGHRGWRRQHQ